MTATSADPRAVNPAFMLGLVALPIVFVWFLFFPGYGRSLRVAALVYAFMPLLFAGFGIAVWLLVWALMRIASNLW
ncbi:hypothetical protein AB5I39_13750 [Sphingomonas sp. MMS24-J45]|uniref:hypothetical protein n=1 Tax=Sphingomonas sp. MMS24-J45 TaxID=3238806 RepID=UPI00384A97DB